MRNRQLYIFVLLLIQILPGRAQQDSITILDEVVLESKLQTFSTGQTLIKLPDSLTRGTTPLLTSALNFHTPVYFKENGYGMVSSASFRGTTASQTAVLWNGININSQFNGQTDFNAINTAGYDNIQVRGGGGSVVYGSGAIGGTVHLNTDLSFGEKLENELFFEYGSFNTLNARYRVKAARGDWSVSIAGARLSSDNDYPYPENRGENINGQFYNNTLNLGVAYRLDHHNIFRFFGERFHGTRHLSLIRPSETKTKYQDENNRYLLEWENHATDFTSLLKLAYLEESYRYYGNIASENFSFGEAENYIIGYDVKYTFSDNILLNVDLTNTYTKGKGSNLSENGRNIFSAVALIKHRLTENFTYEGGLRKEITGNYESPLLFSLSGSYQVSDFYSVQANVSRNFRIPTYNDLYWTSSGNTDLNPETSLQGEIGNSFAWQNFELKVTLYYIDIDDMIRWVPGNDGLWRPRNEDEVRTYGTETFLNWKKRFGEIQVDLNGSYAYTISENLGTGKQLIYVPYHKTTMAAVVDYHNWEFHGQLLYNGEVFTRSDNNTRYNLSSYTVSNAGISYAFGEKLNPRMGVRVLNIFDKAYQSVENRWMPGRNFNINLTLIF